MDIGKLTRFARGLGDAFANPPSEGTFAETEATERALVVSFSANPADGWAGLQFELPPGFALVKQISSRHTRMASFQSSVDPAGLRSSFEELGHTWTSDERIRELGIEMKPGVHVLDLGSGTQCIVSAMDSTIVAMISQGRSQSPA